jgi:hypothetical protein
MYWLILFLKWKEVLEDEGEDMIYNITTFNEYTIVFDGLIRFEVKIDDETWLCRLTDRISSN